MKVFLRSLCLAILVSVGGLLFAQQKPAAKPGKVSTYNQDYSVVAVKGIVIDNQTGQALAPNASIHGTDSIKSTDPKAAIKIRAVNGRSYTSRIFLLKKYGFKPTIGVPIGAWVSTLDSIRTLTIQSLQGNITLLPARTTVKLGSIINSADHVTYSDSTSVLAVTTLKGKTYTLGYKDFKAVKTKTPERGVTIGNMITQKLRRQKAAKKAANTPPKPLNPTGSIPSASSSFAANLALNSKPIPQPSTQPTQATAISTSNSTAKSTHQEAKPIAPSPTSAATEDKDPGDLLEDNDSAGDLGDDASMDAGDDADADLGLGD